MQREHLRLKTERLLAIRTRSQDLSSGSTPPGTFELPVCPGCSAATGGQLDQAMHITIEEPDELSESEHTT